MAAINLYLRIVLKSSRCTVYMLSQNLHDETKDVGKQHGLSMPTNFYRHYVFAKKAFA